MRGLFYCFVFVEIDNLILYVGGQKFVVAQYMLTIVREIFIVY